MALIKQSTAVFHIPFLMVDSTDHVTGKTGLTPTVTISKNCGSFASPSGAITEIANGWYKLAANATDSNTLGALCLHATGTGADPTDMFVGDVVSFDPQDAVRAGLTSLANASAGASGGLLISGSNSGTTTLAALTVTGALTVSDGIAVSRSTSNTTAMTLTGNGTGNGLTITSGSGATGTGLAVSSAATNGTAATFAGAGTGNGVTSTGGATGHGISAVGGATSGSGLRAVATTSGNGIIATGVGTSQAGFIATGGSTSSNGITATGGGTGHGISATSGSGATGNGISATAASTNGSGMTLTKTGTGSDLNATSTPLTLAKTTNITGFNDIAATAIVSSGAITTSSGAVSSVTTVGSVTGAVGSVTGAVGSVTGNVGGNVTGTIGGLTAGALADLFDTDSGTTYASAVAGSVVKEIADNAGGASLTLADIADAVWDEATSGHSTAGTTGKALTDAGSAGDPWGTSVPGAYSAGTAGYILGTNLNATVSSRATQTSVDTIDTNVDSILVDTAEIGAAGAGLTVLATAAELAKVPKSDGTASWNATALAAINAQADTALADVGVTTTVTDRIDAAVSTRLASASYTAPLDAAGTRTAVGLASANLDAQLSAIVTDTGTDIPASIAALNDISVTDILNTTLAELTVDPGATPAIKNALMLLYMALRNKRETTATTDDIFNDSGTSVLTATVSDDTVTFTKGKYA